MSSKAVLGAFGFGVIVLAIALLTPDVISAVDGSSDKKILMETGEEIELNDHLNASLDHANSTTEEFSISLYTEWNETSKSGQEGEEMNLSINNETIHIFSDDVRTGSAIVEIDYPTFIGWNTGERMFMENLPIIFVLLSIISVFGILMVALRP